LVSIGELIFYGTEESLCITNDAKVGVGIANPQRSLEIAGDLVAGGTVSAGNPLMYRNRIINGDMRIAQRGTSLALSSGVANYLIDRFTIGAGFSAGGATYYQNTLSVSDTPYQYGFRYAANVVVNSAVTASYLLPSHFIEGYNIQDLNWGTSFGIPVTLSFWFRTNAPTGSQFNASIGNYGYSTSNYNIPFTITNSGTWQYYTYTIPPPPNGSSWNSGTSGSVQVYIAPYYPSVITGTPLSWGSGVTMYGNYPWYATAGTSIAFTGVQLEKGTIATPFEVRPYATELALCQRYYYSVNSSSQSGGYAVMCQGSFVGSTTLAQCLVNFPVTMRAITSSANFSNSAVGTFFFSAGSGATCTAVTLVNNAQNVNGAQVQFTTSSAVTAGTGCIIEANNTTAAFLGFSAEL